MLTDKSSPKEVREAWSKRLRENPDLRRTDKLASKSGSKRCCFGLLCDMAIEAKVISNYDYNAKVPPDLVIKWVLIKNTGIETLMLLNDEPSDHTAVAGMDKGIKKSWVFIADIIEQNPHEVLFRKSTRR